ncbi:hypothetical protein KIPB_016039, partial [Kipferlia bialata]
GFIRVWCGCHQLDLVRKTILDHIERGFSWLAELLPLVQDLRGSSWFCGEYGRCPTYMAVRWWSLLAVLRWLCGKWEEVEEFHHMQPQWWILTFVLRDLFDDFNDTMERLQKTDLTLDAQ